jgi:hypothetical protein
MCHHNFIYYNDVHGVCRALCSSTIDLRHVYLSIPPDFPLSVVNTSGKRFLVCVSKRVWKRKSCAVESSLLLGLCLEWCSVSMSPSLGAGSPLVTRSSLVRWTLLSLCTLTMLLCCIGGVPHWGISCSESAARQRKTTHQGGDTYRELPRAGHCTGLGGDREKKTSRRNVMFVSVCLEVNLQSFL